MYSLYHFTYDPIEMKMQALTLKDTFFQ